MKKTNSGKLFIWVLFLMTVLTAPSAFAGQCTTYNSDHKGDFKGEASIVFFYMGDDYATTLVQETVDISKAFKGMDYKVLLFDQDATATSKISKANAIAQADEIHLPTKDNLLNAIRDLADDGYMIDIYIIAHGNGWEKSSGEDYAYFSSQDGKISSTDLAKEFGDGCEMPIRMVYTTGCYHSFLNNTWIDIGAKAVAGARHINFYPTQFSEFASQWYKGKSFATALKNSNTSSSRTVVQLYVEALSLGYSGKGECGLIPNVLNKSDCAEWFFTGGGIYNLGDDYVTTMTGKGNMNYSSYKLTDGDTSITRNSALSWDL